MHKTSWRCQVLQISVRGLLSFSGCWLVGTAIVPPAVQAYVSRSDVALDVQVGESYTAFLSRAETVARAAIQRHFDRDILISEAYVVVVGQRQGQATPVLSVRVSRNQWRSRPDSRRWATYFPSARILLGFNNPSTNPTGRTPTATTSPSPAPTATIVNPPTTTSPLQQLLPPSEPSQPSLTPSQAPGSTPLPPTSPTR